MRILLLLAAALVAAGCGDNRQPAKAPAAKAAAPLDPAAVRLTQELAAQVKLEPPQRMDIAETLRIAGRLEVDGYRTARVGAPITGRITDIRAVLGQQVNAGQVLAELSSPELGQAQLAFLRAHSNESLLSRAAERAQLLLAADVIGSAELQRRQSELAVARAEKRAAADQLRVLGLSQESVERLEKTGAIRSVAPITTVRAGTVIERRVSEGQVVQPSDALFVVSDLSSVWAAAEVPEQQAAQVRMGQRVAIQIPALNDESRIGRIVQISDVVNPETRTIRVGAVLDNPGRALKPAMLITMLIEAKSQPRLVVPGAAVVREHDADHVFVETGAGAVTLRKLRLGPESNGMRPLLDPLPDGARVVTEGAFHLNNERQRRNLERPQ